MITIKQLKKEIKDFPDDMLVFTFDKGFYVATTVSEIENCFDIEEFPELESMGKKIDKFTVSIKGLTIT